MCGLKGLISVWDEEQLNIVWDEGEGLGVWLSKMDFYNVFNICIKYM